MSLLSTAHARQRERAVTSAALVPVAGEKHTVTLVTGDRVTVGAGGGLAVKPGAGRARMTFVTQTHDGHHVVIPSDALPLIGAGRLDRRLFDVTLLREAGYDDRRADLPVIVTGSGAASRGATAGAEVVRALPAVGGVAAKVDKATAGEFWDSLTTTGTGGARTLATGVSAVWLDGMRRLSLDQSVPRVGAPTAWQAGLDGSGVTVAVLDTGIDADHPDLAGRVVASENFTEGAEDGRDLVGHGTHVASTIAGSGAASGGRYRGVAPGARLLDGKVCVRRGCPDSLVLAGMQWAAERGATVVNMSLGGTDTPGLDLLERAVQDLTERYGVLFVVAAGNEGEAGDGTVSSPATADAALAVGAVDRRDALAEFSGRGPGVDGALKPDVTAPGVDIVAARGADSEAGTPGEPYMTMTGTSMAAPHAAGAAAILTQQHPKWTPEQRKAALIGSAVPDPAHGPYAQGAGRIDVARAIGQPVTAGPASVSFSHQRWPRHDDKPQSQTVTYSNHGAEDLTLTVEPVATGPDGEPAPAGMFQLSASTLTVPVGGTADVTITADTAVGDLSGYFGGRLTATGGGVVVSTPFAVSLEGEAYDLTLTHTDRAGTPTTGHLTTLYRTDGRVQAHVPKLATTTLRVPPGQYTLVSIVFDEPGTWTAVLAQPRLTVDGDRSMELDARAPPPARVPRPARAAEPARAEPRGRVGTSDAASFFGVRAQRLDDIFTARLGGDQAVDGFAVAPIGTWAKRNADGTFAGSPYSYHLAWPVTGRMISGFTREVRRRDLATVAADHAATQPGTVGWKATKVVLPGFGEIGGIEALPSELPFRRTEYYNADGGVRWYRVFEEVSADGALVSLLESGPVGAAYRPGQSYQEKWNYGAFGPALLPQAPPSWPPVARIGNLLRVDPSLYGDGGRARRMHATHGDGDRVPGRCADRRAAARKSPHRGAAGAGTVPGRDRSRPCAVGPVCHRHQAGLGVPVRTRRRGDRDGTSRVGGAVQSRTRRTQRRPGRAAVPAPGLREPSAGLGGRPPGPVDHRRLVRRRRDLAGSPGAGQPAGPVEASTR
ncbi:S8 family serine peptidase [Micromonospora sp. CPCC 205371]|nr:S8 family serine peptidase [Micromonospora sp. CPCC 205371]